MSVAGMLGALILALPLAAAALLGFPGLFGGKLKGRTPGLIALGAAGGSFLLAIACFLTLLGLPSEERVIEASFWKFLELGAGSGTRLSLDVGVYLDPLSITWTLFITGVGSLIFLYSISYMEDHDKPGQPGAGYARYFAYLSLFLFSMLVLVLGKNLVLTFVGWEGVGLCSYLLIGFEYGKETAANAGRKAFLVNRIGDVGFLLAMFWTWKEFGTLEHAELKPLLLAAAAVPPLLALGYFVGAAGKSAQIPLFVWLPDAMAGPTPVSALIHAATMVTAGIYLLCRLSPLFVLAGWVLDVVAWVGALTALLAALIALRQRDIKRVLAYSTVSQLGYMFLACGLGVFASAAFHVVTHAFFKALLFLGAGAVIHSLHGEQDLWKMGGLRQHLPRTASAMRWGAFALAGIAPFAGFFSKDEILGAAFLQGWAGDPSRFALWGIGVATAALTAFYTARMITLCFEGTSRAGHHGDAHGHGHGVAHGPPHEAPPPMAFALTVLKWLALVGGAALGIEALHWLPLHHWLEPTLAPAVHDLHAPAALPWLLMALALGIALLSWRIGANAFRGDFATARRLELSAPRLARLLEGRFWVDEIYDRLIVRPLRFLAELSLEFDQRVIDGFFSLLAQIAALFATLLRLLQSGVVHAYAFWFLAGAAFLLWLAAW